MFIRSNFCSSFRQLLLPSMPRRNRSRSRERKLRAVERDISQLQAEELIKEQQIAELEKEVQWLLTELAALEDLVTFPQRAELDASADA